MGADEALVMRQAFAGMLWSKQFYNYDVATWLDGDPAQLVPLPDRELNRNSWSVARDEGLPISAAVPEADE